MTTKLHRRDMSFDVVNSTMILTPGRPAKEDFGLLLGLHTGIMEQMTSNIMLVHRTAEVFGNDTGEEIEMEQAAVLLYDPAQDGMMQMDVVRLAYTSIPEDVRPEVFIPLRLTKAMLAAIFIEGMALMQQTPWIGKVEEDMDSGDQWMACRRIILTQGHDRAEALATVQSRLVKDAIDYEGADRDPPAEAEGGRGPDQAEDTGSLDIR